MNAELLAGELDGHCRASLSSWLLVPESGILGQPMYSSPSQKSDQCFTYSVYKDEHLIVHIKHLPSRALDNCSSAPKDVSLQAFETFLVQ